MDRATGTAVPEAAGRYRSLDALRGIAAIAVVAHHCALTSPGLAAAYADLPAPSRTRTWTATPLHLLWPGSVPVYLFFVLSGFVLSLPGAVSPSWNRYWVKRSIRLYVPIWAALVLAYALVLAVPRTALPGQSWWMAVHSEPITARLVAVNAVVLRGTSWVDSPLWSLRYELFFSFLLPVLLPLTVRLARRPVPLLAALVGAVVLGTALDAGWLVHLPMFFVGVALAVHRQALAAWFSARGRLVWLGTLALALGLMVAPWCLPVMFPATEAAGLVGAALVIVAFLGPQSAAFGRSRVLGWLARLSFGLYLVHEPLTVTAATLFPQLPPPGLFAVVLPVALAVAWVMVVLVEGPSRRLARWASDRTPSFPEVRALLQRSGADGRPALVGEEP